MPRSKSSKRWLREHFADEFVRRAQKAGYRSRSVYKLEEIQRKYRLFRPGMIVVDLGAAPGGWSQYAAGMMGGQGAIFALDLLPMEPLQGVEFMQGDFGDDEVVERFMHWLEGRSIDLVMSDMAPNISGMKAVDQPRAMYLVELAAAFANRVLAPDGTFLVKVFQGEGFEAVLRQMRAAFGRVSTYKPKASRDRSREFYVLARNPKV